MKMLKKIAIFIFTRTFFLYCLLALLIGLTANSKQTVQTARLRTLNRLLPPLQELIDSNHIDASIDDVVLARYVFYYQKVGDYMPNNANAHYMSGYCLALQNERDMAIRSFTQSSAINPGFFWTHYNLGILFLGQRNFDKASAAFKKALQTKPDITLKMILSSKVFQQLLAEIPDPGSRLTGNIKAAYKDCYKLLMLSQRLKGVGGPELPDTFYNNLRLRIF